MTDQEMDKYLNKTTLLNFDNKVIQELMESRNWNSFAEKERILYIYNFVRDEIRFGYNRKDALPASEILKDGYGQCNTKGILFMALLRAAGIPCRLHGFTIHKELQKGVISGIWYRLAPEEIVHSWVEVYYSKKWLNIEGFILDLSYLKKLQQKFEDHSGFFCGYGVCTKAFKKPDIYWNENDTYIQKEGIKQDFGLFDDPDSFYRSHTQELNFMKKFLYQNLTRHLMNSNVNKIRSSIIN